MTIITSTQPTAEGAPQARAPARARAQRALRRPRARTCVAAADAPAGRRVEGYRVAGQRARRADFDDVEPDAAARRSRTLGSGTRVIGVYEQRWARAAPGRCASYLHGVARPRQRRHGAALRAGLRRLVRRARARTAPTRTRQGGARVAWARSSPSPLARVRAASSELPGRARRARAHDARRSRCAAPRARRRERAHAARRRRARRACRTSVVARLRRGRADPDRRPSR